MFHLADVACGGSEDDDEEEDDVDVCSNGQTAHAELQKGLGSLDRFVSRFSGRKLLQGFICLLALSHYYFIYI